ncbi:MAG: ATP-binding protein [Nitrospirota bacterium]|nr:ATP-binding protein [Nitrospirota bacterium]
MLLESQQEIIEHIKTFNHSEGAKVGVVGPDGMPAFATGIPVPKEIFASQKEANIITDDELIFYRPLKNSERCRQCHKSEDKTRGMLVIKTSMKKANAEIKGTARRLLFLALLLGLASEFFLLFVLRKKVLNPLENLAEGSEILKSGKFEHRLDIKGDDEIGALASCFNEMAESIERSHVHLESAVRQRTKELRVIAELSLQAFSEDLTLQNLIEQFLNAITDRMGFGYTALCLVDRETGLLSQKFAKGVDYDFCDMELSLASDHPFSKLIREARPALKKYHDIDVPEEYGNVAIVPLLSFHRKTCWEAQRCLARACASFESADKRCWLIADTLRRSPQARPGKDKIFGCLQCTSFPIRGVLIAGKHDEISKPSLHSLEILASQIAAGMENLGFLEGKKEDIGNIVKLHDISAEFLQALNVSELAEFVVSYAAAFAGVDASILWLVGDNFTLHLEKTCNIAQEDVPESLHICQLVPDSSLIEDRLAESILSDSSGCLYGLFSRYGFRHMSVVPLRIKTTIYGCLTLFKKDAFFMSESEKAVISLFAAQSAVAMHTAKLYSELMEQKKFSDAIFDNVSSGLLVMDREGRILKINDIGVRHLKLDISDAVGRKICDIYPETLDMICVTPGFSREVTIALSDGNAIPIGFSNSPLFDAAGKQTGVIVLFKDLTEIKKLQDALNRKQHFETMGKVTAGVAHEIRNPLFGISAVAQILQREIKDEQHNKLLQAMIREVQRLNSLVSELLIYSRPSKLNIAMIDFGALCERLQQYVHARKIGAVLTLEAAPDAVIKADMDKLTQVFLNLIDNAIGGGGTKIDITAARLREGGVTIRIRDNGSGIKEKDLEKVFDPFYTTKKEGTGLGLSISKKIMQDHGGDIELISTEGKGTTVILHFKAGQD